MDISKLNSLVELYFKKTEEVEFAKRQAEREERERKRAKEDGGERHLHQE